MGREFLRPGQQVRHHQSVPCPATTRGQDLRQNSARARDGAPDRASRASSTISGRPCRCSLHPPRCLPAVASPRLVMLVVAAFVGLALFVGYRGLIGPGSNTSLSKPTPRRTVTVSAPAVTVPASPAPQAAATAGGPIAILSATGFRPSRRPGREQLPGSPGLRRRPRDYLDVRALRHGSVRQPEEGRGAAPGPGPADVGPSGHHRPWQRTRRRHGLRRDRVQAFRVPP